MPWINNLPPVCWSTFQKSIWYDSGFVSLTQWRTTFSLNLSEIDKEPINLHGFQLPLFLYKCDRKLITVWNIFCSMSAGGGRHIGDRYYWHEKCRPLIARCSFTSGMSCYVKSAHAYYGSMSCEPTCAYFWKSGKMCLFHWNITYTYFINVLQMSIQCIYVCRRQ